MCQVNEHWCRRMPLEHKKSMIHYIQKNEDKIRRSTNTSAPTSVKISYEITLDPLVEKMEGLVCMVG
jgi:aspartate ammonia-lyase